MPAKPIPQRVYDGHRDFLLKFILSAISLVLTSGFVFLLHISL